MEDSSSATLQFFQKKICSGEAGTGGEGLGLTVYLKWVSKSVTLSWPFELSSWLGLQISKCHSHPPPPHPVEMNSWHIWTFQVKLDMNSGTLHRLDETWKCFTCHLVLDGGGGGSTGYFWYTASAKNRSCLQMNFVSSAKITNTYRAPPAPAPPTQTANEYLLDPQQQRCLLA